MGIHNLEQIITELNRGGLSLDTPIALVRWGTTPQQEELLGTLATIQEQIIETQFAAPAIAVIGRVVELAIKTGSNYLTSPESNAI